jgi:hypothetical protein
MLAHVGRTRCTIDIIQFVTMVIKCVFYFTYLVKLIPKLKIIPESLTVQEGDSAEFVCNVKSLRPTQIIWSRHDGKALSKRASVERNVLRFDNLQKSDRGSYVCTASNDIALRTAKSLLVVRSK